MIAAEVLDLGCALAVRRAGALLACGAAAWGGLYAAGLTFARLILGSEGLGGASGARLLDGGATPLALLGAATLTAGAWLVACWARAAALRICAGEIEGTPLGSGQAWRRGLGDLPLAALASAARIALTALAIPTLGLALPALMSWSGPLMSAAVLDRASPLAALRQRRRSRWAWAAASALPAAAAALIWVNLLAAWLVTSEGLQQLALPTPGDLPALLLSAVLALILAEPFRVGAQAAAWSTEREAMSGGDLSRRLEAL